MLPEPIVFWTLVVLSLIASILLMRAREPKNRRFSHRVALLLLVLVVLTYALHVTGVYP